MPRTNAVAPADDKGTLSHFSQKLVDRNSGKMTVVGVNLAMVESVVEVSVMMKIHVDSHSVNTFCLLDPESLFGKLSSSEIGRLVHVDPYA